LKLPLTPRQQIKAKFTVDDQRHYLFSPKHLTQWVFGLLRYEFSAGDALVPWMNEARRLFRDVLVVVCMLCDISHILRLSKTLRSLTRCCPMLCAVTGPMYQVFVSCVIPAFYTFRPL
jgi:dynein heavy chain 2